MVSAVVKGDQSLDPKRIVKDVNKKFGTNFKVKHIDNYLQGEFYPEIQYLEDRHKGFDGTFYF